MIALALAGWVLGAATLLAAARGRRRGRRRAARRARLRHELRGPLQAANLALHAAARAAAPSGPDGRRGLEALEVELARAALALADLERLEDGASAGLPPARLELLDLGAVVARQAAGWEARAERAGRTLVCARAAEGPALIRGDALRLAQAAGNLVANALDHGTGLVTVRVRAATRGRVALEVTDDGPGLPGPLGDLQDVGPTGPHGHGLRVCADVAAAHGGRLHAAPSPRGARLRLELPGACLAPGSVGRAE